MREDRGNGFPPDEGSAMRVPDGSFIADRQFVAATSPAAREHGAAILGFHARAESMCLGALAIIRLKCAFRHGLFLLSTARKTTRVGALRIVDLNRLPV